MTRSFRVDPILPAGEVAALRRALDAAGWRETIEKDWDLYWDGTLPDAEFFASLRSDQWVNHFPGYGVFGDKRYLHENLSRSWDRTGRFRRLHPRSYSMPDEYFSWRETAAAEPEQLWLLKPRRLSQGREISMILDPDEVPLGPKWIVQEYLQRPHLLDGHKYVLRFYLLVTSLDPLLCYLHERGVCKLTSRPYTLDADSLGDRFVHLTNPPIQRHNEEVLWGSLNSDHVAYRQRLCEQGVDDEKLFDRIRDVLIETVIACREETLMRSRAVSLDLSRCFEFIGVDMIIDEDLEPWVLECNPTPALAVDSAYDAEAAQMVVGTKEAVVADMVSLLGFSRPPREPGSADPETYWRGRAELEMAGAAGFERIWPAPDADRFLAHFPLLRPLDQMLASDACPRVPATTPEIRPSSGVASYALGEGLALFATHRQDFFALNASAAAAWLCLGDGLLPALAADELAAVTPEQPPELVTAAVWDLLVAWAQSGLLAGFEQTSPSAGPGLEAKPLEVVARRLGSVIFVPLGAGDTGEETSISLPAADVRRLVLLLPSAESKTRLSIGFRAAALDALIGAPGVEVALDPAAAAALVGWLDGLEVYEIEIVDGEEAEALRLLDLVSS